MRSASRVLRRCNGSHCLGRLLGMAVPVLMITDPPYGVNYDPLWREEAGLGVQRWQKLTGRKAALETTRAASTRWERSERAECPRRWRVPRPSVQPTKEQRQRVKLRGHRHEDACAMVGIRSPKTLRKHFRQE